MAELDEPSPQQLFEEARASQGRGEHAQAVELLRRVVEQGGDWETRFRYANSLAVEGQIEQAYEVWREVVALPEWNPSQVQGELAGQFTEAMRHVSFETTVDADDPKSAYLQAKVAQLFDQPDVVKHALIKTLTRGHDYEDTLEWLMRLFQQEGQYDEALKLVEPLLMQAPQSPALNYWAGELSHQTGRTAVAVRILANAVKLDPARWQGQARLAEIYAAQHRFEEADVAYQAALRLQPDDFDLIMGSVEAAKRLYQFDRALELLEKATQLKPGDLQVQIEFAQLCFQMGAMARAVPGLELGLRASPEDPQLLANLARAYYGTGQYDKAAPMLAKALQTTPDGELAYLCARSLAELKQRPQALEALKKAVELSPDRPQYQASLGKELLSLGQTEEALKALAAAADLEPKNAMAQLNVAGVYKKVGQTSSAMDSYLRASAIEPERVDVHLQIGVLGLTCDRLEEAANAFIEVLRLSPAPHPMALAGVAQIYQRRGLSDVAVDFYRQALQANPGMSAAAQAVSVIFAKDKDIEGLLVFLTDLLDFFKSRPDDARALFSTFSSYLESKGLIGFCTEISALFAERFPSPEAFAERSRLFMLRAEQLQSKGDAIRAYHILQRLHGFEPKPELAVRLEAMRTALGAALESRPEPPATPAPTAEAVLDSMSPPAPAAVAVEAPPAEEQPKEEAKAEAEAEAEEPSPEAAPNGEQAPSEPRAELAQPEPLPQPEFQPAVEPAAEPAIEEADVAAPEETPTPVPTEPVEESALPSVVEAEAETGNTEFESPIETQPTQPLENPADAQPAPPLEGATEASPAPHLEEPTEASPAPHLEDPLDAQPAAELDSSAEPDPEPEPVPTSENTDEPASVSEPEESPESAPSDTSQTQPENESEPSEQAATLANLEDPVNAQPAPHHEEPTEANPAPHFEDPVNAQPAAELDSSAEPEPEPEPVPASENTDEPAPLSEPEEDPDTVLSEAGQTQPENEAEPSEQAAPFDHLPEADTPSEPEQDEPTSEKEAVVESPGSVPELEPTVATPASEPVPLATATEPEAEAQAQLTTDSVEVVVPPESFDPPEVAQPDPEPEIQPEPVSVVSPAEQPSPLPAPPPPSRFVRERFFELRAHSHRPTQQHLWERSLGEYLLASASSRAYKQPREIDEDTADELCDIYLDSAKILRDAGWLEQACTTLSTALLYNPQHQAVADELEETVLEWVEFLDEEEAYEQALMLLEGQWERRPGDKLRSRARALFGGWANAMRQEGDHYGAEALEAHWATRMQYWEALRSQWSARAASPWPPSWQESE